jgi:hypothetical protein
MREETVFGALRLYKPVATDNLVLRDGKICKDTEDDDICKCPNCGTIFPFEGA